MLIPITQTGPHASTLATADPISTTCNDIRNCRTIWNIIWSSLATLFACIWIAIHPNIPAQNDSWGRIFIRRVWIMILALLTPEIVVAWAARQYIAANRLAKRNKGN
jgi:hypothetical protein